MSAGAKLWVCVDPTAERKLWVPAKGDATGILQVYDATSFASLATLLARIGDPSAHTLTSLTAKWGNIARSLDLILGARWDGAGDLGTDIAAIIAAQADLDADLIAAVVILNNLGGVVTDVHTDVGTLIAEHVIIWGGVSYTTGIVDDIKAYVDTEGGVSLADKLTAARAALLDKLANLVGTPSTGTFSLVNNVNEQDARVVAAATQLVDIELDMVNTTQLNTVRIYSQVDGANYRQIQARVFPTDFDTSTKMVTISHPQKNALFKVTLQASVLEGVARDIPWRQMVRPLV
jgi:hypothetical protein